MVRIVCKCSLLQFLALLLLLIPCQGNLTSDLLLLMDSSLRQRKGEKSDNKKQAIGAHRSIQASSPDSEACLLATPPRALSEKLCPGQMTKARTWPQGKVWDGFLKMEDRLEGTRQEANSQAWGSGRTELTGCQDRSCGPWSPAQHLPSVLSKHSPCYF